VAYKKAWADSNSDRLKEEKKRRYESSKEENAEKCRAWYLKNREKAIKSAAISRSKRMAEDPDSLREDSRKRARARLEKDPDGVRKKRREYAAKRRETDPIFRLNEVVSRAVRRGLKHGKDGKSWRRLVDFSLDELMAHLERQFLPGMAWDNYGEWHVDHIVPLAAHNYETPDDIDFKRAWSLENLQPLWARDNLSKGARLDIPFQPSLALGC
jgi:5-methylcytosine-specific restriction endonuclease McrA